MAFSLSAGTVALLGYYIVSWAPVFDSHSIRRFTDFLQTVYVRIQECQSQKTQAIRFFSAPATWRIFQQYAKVFIGYLQVSASCNVLQVPWVKSLQDFLFAVSGTEYLVVLDWMQFPGWLCLVGRSLPHARTH